MEMKGRSIFLVTVLLVTPRLAVLADVPLQSSPAWESQDTDYSTGGALGDIDGDGYLDLAVSNGNDMASQQNCVYHNLGGTFETVASWRSADHHYAGHCALGDINQDGWLDLVVANYGTQSGPIRKQLDNLYLNIGGMLETSPVWNSAPSDSDNSFGCALGDVDGDGDLDVVMACGEGYTNTRQYSKLYLNHAGILDTFATWKSFTTGYSYDAAWGDVDNDGDLDLVLPHESAPNELYLNNGGGLDSEPSWLSADVAWSERVALGDVNNDGYLDLAVADNAQLGGQSKIKIYMNHQGQFESLPSWSSKDTTRRYYYSCVAWGDVNGDGWLDLAAGGWWEPLVVFENHQGVLDTLPTWSWYPAPGTGTLVCEQVVWGDIDNDGLHPITDSINGDGVRKLFYLAHHPAHSLQQIRINGSPLGQTEYCCDLGSGWISLKNAPAAGTDNVQVDYVYSTDLDLIVTNWDPPTGNFLFLNTSHIGIEAKDALPVSRSDGSLHLVVSPNPFRDRLSIRVGFGSGPISPASFSIRVFNLTGQVVRTLFEGSVDPGRFSLYWDGRDQSGQTVADGMYLIRMDRAGIPGFEPPTQKVILLR